MKQVPDRKKLRQDYLVKRTYASIGGLMGWILLFALSAAAILCACMAVLSILIGTITAMLYLGLAVAGGFASYKAWRIIARSEETIANLPYVAPIAPDTLPAEEILVRGSSEPPVAQSEVLLRAAQGQETPKEELLRVVGE